MLDLDTVQINSFAIEWPRWIPDEDMHAGVLIISSQHLMHAKQLQREYDRRYFTLNSTRDVVTHDAPFSN